MLEYTYKKAQDLGYTQRELLEVMDAEELQYWIAFDSLQNSEHREKINTAIMLEQQRENPDITNNALRAFLSSLGSKK